MKVSKCRLLVIAFLLIFALGLFFGALFEKAQEKAFDIEPGNWFGGDLGTRMSEVACAHLGVNSFHIWNREVEVKGFVPMSRPDKSDVVRQPGDRTVHAYPAWHNFYFYFYGWMTERICRAVMACLFGLCLAFVFCRIRKLAQEFTVCDKLCALGILMMVSYYLVNCFYWQNYSLLVVAMIFATGILIEGGHEIMAGVCWGIAMTKPQMAMLLFWPLLFRRNFVAIVVAVLTCLGATIIMGWHYHESPLALLFQIPQIGAPYTNTMAGRFLGTWGNYLQTFFFCVVCGCLCYCLRRADRWYERFAPVSICAPLWTYGQQFDKLIFIFWYCVVAREICIKGSLRKLWVGYACYSIFTYLFRAFWNSCTCYGLFSAQGIGWIYRGIEGGWYLTSFVMLAILCTSQKGNEK